MRLSEIVLDGEKVVERSVDAATEPLTEMAGTPLNGVGLWARLVAPWGRLEVVELAVGAELPLHSGDELIVCQVVSGRGLLSLPDGSDVPFVAPHLFTFEPGAVHGWHGIEEPTRLSIFVAAGQG